MTLIDKENISSILPQRHPFILIDELLERHEALSVTGFEITEEHMMIEDGCLSAEGLLENIAQTAAAGVGFDHRKSGAASAPKGYIGVISKAQIHSTPAIGSVIRSTAEVTNTVMNVTIVDGKAWDGDTLLAECEMKIFIDEKSS